MNFVRGMTVSLASICLLASSAMAQHPVYGSPVGHGGGPGVGAPSGPRPGGPGPGVPSGPRPGQGGPVYNPPRPPSGPMPGQTYPGPVYGTPVGHGGGPIYNPPRPPVYNPPVYNPGPVYHPPVYNPPYNNYPYPGQYSGPVFSGPVFHFPTYPVYQSFPSGPCTIYSNSYSGSGAYYSVTNAYGQTIGTTYDYYQAQQIAQNALNQRSCSYINNYTNSYQQPNFCQIMPGGNAYGQDFYRVIDNQGRIINNSCSYQDALSIVQSSAQCYQQ